MPDDVNPTAQGANNCGSCKFMGERALSGTICQRYPPIDASGAFSFPQVQATVDWCGEHQPTA